MGTGGRRWLASGIIAFAWSAAAAQGTSGGPPPNVAVPPGGGYAVTGRVVCGDTQRPARFALVTLIPADQGDGNFGGRGGRGSARTDLDGNFTMSNVAAGSYFVTGSLAGYVNETSEVQAALSAGADPGTALPGVPEVNVTAGGASTALTLQRGGVIAGTVLWDDGSPAGGVQVFAQVAPTAGVTSTGAPQTTTSNLGRSGGFGGFGAGPAGAQSDDRGRYRLTGLLPGTYLVRASVQAPAPGASQTRGFARTLNLYVYAPDKMRRTEAAMVTLAGSEERDDVAITMKLAGLHTISGNVGATSATVRSGTVTVTDQADSSLTRTGSIGGDGSFTVPYVPPGNYTLNVNASAQAQGTGGRGSDTPANSAESTRFQPLQESLTVTDGDLTGLSLNVTPVSSSP